jgi:hypothetical protein
MSNLRTRLKRLENEMTERPSDDGLVFFYIPDNGRDGLGPRTFVSGNARVIIYDPNEAKKNESITG